MHKHEVELNYKIGIISISTSRSKRYGELRGIDKIGDFDESSKIVYETFKENVVNYVLIPDDVDKIRKAISEVLRDADVCITIGGTGISPSDVTIEAVKPMFTKELEGFGEIFRMLSYKEIGVSAALTRAVAGLIGHKVVFCLPGSRDAVKLGVDIIKQLIKHLLSHARGLT